MIAVADMERTARSFLRASRILSRREHAEYDAAAYLCGYAVEIALKVRICRTLGWAGYPETNAEFQNFASFKMHNLDALLRLTGREARVKTHPGLAAAWSVARGWTPEQRYDRRGTKTATDARDMTAATATLLRALL